MVSSILAISEQGKGLLVIDHQVFVFGLNDGHGRKPTLFHRD